MKEKNIIIQNELGLHARAAATFSKEASKFSSTVEVLKDHMQINGKSILELLTLAATKGSTITIRAEGNDESNAIEALTSLVQEGFGEQ